ncbi:MAG: GTPase ObgE [Clostridiales bacterium]|nr:GTPase ObgE [Clostridiales bacterium]
MFIDHAKIYVKAGDGGPGCVSFHTEKFVTNGGPDGGDGGKGGDVVFVAVRKITTLQSFRFKHKFVAPDGSKGMNRKMYGRGGEDLKIAVPVGTLIKDAATGKILADMTEDKQEVVIAKGGKGGLGNMHYANAVRQAPRFARAGVPGEEKELLIELKLIADVGLVGYPNAGKSTLLSVMTAAKPKIADYPFTTLEPVLGVVSDFDTSFVIADIPGLIDNAHEGAGLGHDFLRHIERTRLLIHVVDVSSKDGRDPLDDFDHINEELTAFNEKLASRPQVVVANKCDAASDEEIEMFVEGVKERGYEDIFVISAAARIGIKELTDRVTELVSKLPQTVLHDELTDDHKIYKFEKEDQFNIVRSDDGAFEITGTWALVTMESTNFDDTDSLAYFQRSMINSGVIDALKAAGIKEGDTVRIGDLEFDYFE